MTPKEYSNNKQRLEAMRIALEGAFLYQIKYMVYLKPLIISPISPPTPIYQPRTSSRPLQQTHCHLLE